jgi:hypothetical protein
MPAACINMHRESRAACSAAPPALGTAFGTGMADIVGGRGLVRTKLQKMSDLVVEVRSSWGDPQYFIGLPFVPFHDFNM